MPHQCHRSVHFMSPNSTVLDRNLGDTNKHRYVVATQSKTLRGLLRAIPAVPLVHFTRSVMILEPPADVTLRSKALVCAP